MKINNVHKKDEEEEGGGYLTSAVQDKKMIRGKHFVRDILVKAHLISKLTASDQQSSLNGKNKDKVNVGQVLQEIEMLQSFKQSIQPVSASEVSPA